LTISGPVDLTVADSLRSDLLAVLSEALSNVVKHARATAVAIDVSRFWPAVLRLADDGTASGTQMLGMA
jgi:signal transduction histidine kinase